METDKIIEHFSKVKDSDLIEDMMDATNDLEEKMSTVEDFFSLLFEIRKANGDADFQKTGDQKLEIIFNKLDEVFQIHPDFFPHLTGNFVTEA